MWAPHAESVRFAHHAARAGPLRERGAPGSTSSSGRSSSIHSCQRLAEPARSSGRLPNSSRSCARAGRVTRPAPLRPQRPPRPLYGPRLQGLHGLPDGLGQPIAQRIVGALLARAAQQEVKLGLRQLPGALEHRDAQLRRHDQLVPLEEALRAARAGLSRGAPEVG